MATIIVKATEKCNSNCYYCDVVYKKNTGKSMPLNILEEIFKKINEYLLQTPDDDIQFVWHGGEPLLLGPDYYKKAADYQDKYCKTTNNRITHYIQTNLTCLNEDFIDIFNRLGIRSIGTSYDPEPNVRGPGIERDTNWYNGKFLQALSILDKNNIKWGMIYVVTKKSLKKPLDIFFYLTNLLLSGGIRFNQVLIYDQERKDISISSEEFFEFLGQIFPFWWEHRDRYPNIDPFRSLTDTIVNGQISMGCVESGTCTYNHINITPDGETSQCGRSADWGLLGYGNIMNKTIKEILFDTKRDELHRRLDVLNKGECRGCRFWEICHGGCPLDSYSIHKSFMYKSEWCEARKKFITKYFEPITGVRYEKKTE